MTDEEKAESAVKCYLNLNTPVAKALIIDIVTLLRDERREVLELVEETVDKLRSGR